MVFHIWSQCLVPVVLNENILTIHLNCLWVGDTHLYDNIFLLFKPYLPLCKDFLRPVKLKYSTKKTSGESRRLFRNNDLIVCYIIDVMIK